LSLEEGVEESREAIKNTLKDMADIADELDFFDFNFMEASFNEDVNKEFLERAEATLYEAKEEFIEKTYEWENSNKEFKILREKIPAIIRCVNTYGETSSFDDVLGEVRRCQNEIEKELFEEEQDIKFFEKNVLWIIL
jgi:hypothetical protein